MRKKRASLHNLGCKVNAYELDVMKQLLVEAGYEIVPFTEPADICIINTCTVTNTADRKSRQMLHRARKKNPDAVIVAVGCYVQTADPEKLKAEGIDLCIGNNKKGQIAAILAEYLEGRKAEYREELRGGCEYEKMHLMQIDSHTRAYIKVQDGCNQFCTYCIIPAARGSVRSRKKEEILEEVHSLAESGVREFVITGIHVSSYGSDFVSKEASMRADCFAPELFLELLKEIGEVPGAERIRLSSLEPRIMTEDFVKGLSENPKVCPHFHLSLQSGSDEVLRRMNRHYTAEEYAACTELLRRYFDDPAITTDIIVGFPGETEQMFRETCELAKRVGFYEMHVFPYSKRAGTPAAAMEGQLTEAQKAERLHTLEEIGEKLHEEYLKRQQGKRKEVLFEEERELDGALYLTGQSADYLHVAVRAGAERVGTICSVRIGGPAGNGYLSATLE